MEITWETFLKNIQDMQKLSTEIYDDWKTCRENNLYSEFSTYLTKQIMKQSKTEPFESINTFEYHVVFDGIYSVPKLCFNVFKTDGSLLPLEDCINQLNFEKDDNILEILTQMDHPVLQRPFYSLHPCKTAELMQTIATKTKNPVVTWLSTIGPSVGLNIDIEYATLT